MSDFNWPVLIWPLALLVFVALFFRGYDKDMLRDRMNKKRQTGNRKTTGKKKPAPRSRHGASGKPPAIQEQSALSLPGRPNRMAKQDWFLALALTFICCVLAFSFSGSAETPHTFWRATGENPTVSLDLGREVQLDNLFYYIGLNDRVAGGWVLELSADGQSWTEAPFMSHEYYEVFLWKIPYFNSKGPIPTRFIRLTAKEVWLELGELALITVGEDGERHIYDTSSLSARYPLYSALFDEQNTVPDMLDMGNADMFDKSSEMGLIPGRISDHDNGMVFDEIHHARTAYEYIRGIRPTEATHPPVGKEIISLGISLFGMTPFGWRFMGILFGVLMIPLLYVFIKNLFGSTVIAACGAALLVFENLHFTQTHVATIDTFVVFFILAMYLFMYRYISSDYETPFKKTLPPLFLCGLCFGLGVASKWTGFYAALGLIALYAIYLVKRRRHWVAIGKRNEYRSFVVKTLAVSFGFFVVIPFVIYTLSYIPFTAANGHAPTLDTLLRDMWENQKSMLAHHADPTRDATHPYKAGWWMWTLDIQPSFYFGKIQDGFRTIVSAFTNPLVTIGGLAAIFCVASDFIRKRSKTALVIAVGYLSQLVPWFFVSRATFEYHYFPSMAFLVIAICYVFNNILRLHPEKKKQVYLFTGLSVLVFLMLLPPTAGIRMPDWYSAWFAKWLPTWPF